MKTLNWIIGILFLVSLCANIILFYQSRHQSDPQVIEVHDTLIVTKDSIIEKTLYETHFDTVYIHDIVYSGDTIKDTVVIHLPIEHKVSEFNIEKDSLTINEKIFHSGFKTTIDSVSLDYSLHYSLPQPKQKRFGLVWSVGLYTGYGLNFNNGQYYFSPEVGVGGSIGVGGIIK